jgi:hypothetical protein
MAAGAVVLARKPKGGLAVGFRTHSLPGTELLTSDNGELTEAANESQLLHLKLHTSELFVVGEALAGNAEVGATDGAEATVESGAFPQRILARIAARRLRWTNFERKPEPALRAFVNRTVANKLLPNSVIQNRGKLRTDSLNIGRRKNSAAQRTAKRRVPSPDLRLAEPLQAIPAKRAAAAQSRHSLLPPQTRPAPARAGAAFGVSLR